jgi:YD repeat-containing protein
VEPTITDFYSSYISWNWPGWKLFRRDGRTYIFPDGGGTQVPEQASLIGVQDASGHALRLQRQSNGNLVSASSAEGAWIHFRYDDLRRVSEAKDSAGHELLYGYNAAGCLEEVEDADHHVTQYGHQGARCPTSMTVDHRQVWDAKLDEGARVTELTLADVGTYHFTYSLDSSGAATRIDIRDPGGNVLRLTYYSSGYRLDHLTKGNALAALH